MADRTTGKALKAKAGVVEARAGKRRNIFDGLTEEARHELAVQMIRERWNNVVSSVLGVGQVIVDACHDGAAREALEDQADENGRFTRLCRSLSTLEGGPSPRVLSVARRIAAASDALQSRFWLVVPYSHKEQLIRLPDTRLMAEGAKRAVEFGWTSVQVQGWVRDELAKLNRKTVLRGRSLGGARRSCDHLAAVASSESLQRIARDYRKLSAARKKTARESIARAEAALAHLRRHLAELDEDA